jgi:predicted O-methyltransferase YrrM
MLNKLIDYTVLRLYKYLKFKTTDIPINIFPKSTYDYLVDASRIKGAEYISENMKKTMIFNTKESIWDYALSIINSKGIILEFGVFKGYSINYFAKKFKNKVYGFDSFEGLIENWEGTSFVKGSFNLKGKLPKVFENVTLVKGEIQKTLSDFNFNNDISLIHLDLDTYDSTKFVLHKLLDKLNDKTIILFDEYHSYPGWENQGEFKAFKEFVSENNLKYKYLAFGNMEALILIQKN